MAGAANDDDERGRTHTGEPDPQGEAALLLVESLIHELVARAALPVASAIEVVQTAIDAQLAISDHRGEDPATEPHAVSLLSAIAASLRIEDMPVAGNDVDTPRDGPAA